MLDQLERMLLVLVGDRLKEEALQILLEREVDQGFHRIDATLLCDLR